MIDNAQSAMDGGLPIPIVENEGDKAFAEVLLEYFNALVFVPVPPGKVLTDREKQELEKTEAQANANASATFANIKRKGVYQFAQDQFKLEDKDIQERIARVIKELRTRLNIYKILKSPKRLDNGLEVEKPLSVVVDPPEGQVQAAQSNQSRSLIFRNGAQGLRVETKADLLQPPSPAPSTASSRNSGGSFSKTSQSSGQDSPLTGRDSPSVGRDSFSAGQGSPSDARAERDRDSSLSVDRSSTSLGASSIDSTEDNLSEPNWPRERASISRLTTVSGASNDS